jgi:formate hydrogenlyase transcriptional activator
MLRLPWSAASQGTGLAIFSRLLARMTALAPNLAPAITALIVEDEFLIANDLRRMLTKAGYEVLGLAESAAEARALISQRAPAIVLLDIFLKGDETGLDLAPWLGEQQIPFIYLSANLTDSILAAAKVTQPSPSARRTCSRRSK